MFYLIGNNLAIDLVNTEIVDGGRPVDLLVDFDDVVAWALEAGVIGDERVEKLREKSNASRKALLGEAIALRKLLKAIVEQVALGRRPSRPHLQELNVFLRRNVGFFAVREDGKGFRKEFHAAGNADVFELLMPVAESAADLLCFGDLSKVRKCENPACVLYFYDTSKNHGRSWCSMSACGNRAKASAFYHRRKDQ